MLDGEVLSDFSGLYSVEKEKIDRRLRQDFESKIARLASNGILVSSAAVRALTELATDTIPIRANVAFNIISRTLTAHGVAIAGPVAADVFTEIETCLKTEERHLRAMVLDTPSLKAPGMVAAGEGLLKDIPGVTDLEIRRIDGEIRLIAAANRRASPVAPASTPSMVFNAPVGVVQTGAGSYGVSHQTIDATASDALSKALDMLARDIADLTEPSISSGEALELVADVKAELAKPTPNVSKIRALVSGIASTITFIPSLRPAYDTVKWAGSFLGLTLP